LTPRTARVLIIDSSLLSVRLLKQGLEGQGFGVSAVPSKEQAIQHLKRAPCDVIVAEVTEQIGCGIEIGDYLKNNGLLVPLIALGVNDGDQTRSRAHVAGAKDFLAKPIGVEDVRDSIDRVLREASSSSPAADLGPIQSRLGAPGLGRPSSMSAAAAQLARPARAPAATLARDLASTAASRAEAKSSSGKSSPPGRSKEGPPRVLLVDDDPIVRKFLRVVLEQIGIEIFEAKGAYEAWKIVHRKGVDVLVTDLIMEGHSGFDLLRNLRVQKLKIPAIVLTGHPTMENVTKARKYGALSIIEKSADITPVKDTVTQVLRNLGFDLDDVGR